MMIYVLFFINFAILKYFLKIIRHKLSLLLVVRNSFGRLLLIEILAIKNQNGVGVSSISIISVGGSCIGCGGSVDGSCVGRGGSVGGGRVLGGSIHGGVGLAHILKMILILESLLFKI